jgi:hypothetical protein
VTIGTNSAGTIIFLLGFGIAAAVSYLCFANGAEGPLTIVGGALVAVTDLSYRRWWRRCGVWKGAAGGQLLFLPIWIWGVFWIGLGVGYTIWRGA